MSRARSRRDVLLGRLGLLERLGTAPGRAVPQVGATPVGPLPGCSAERGHRESPPPWEAARRLEQEPDDG